MEWYLLGARVSNANPERILITRNGASFTIPLQHSSRYDGLSFYKSKGMVVNPIKVLDRIDIDEHSELEQVHIRTNEAILIYESGLIVRYGLKCANSKNNSSNALVIHSNKPITGTIWLDTRHPYDTGAFHKNYDVKEYSEGLKRKKYTNLHSYKIDFSKRGELDNTYDLDYDFKLLFESADESSNVERVEWWHPFKDEYDRIRGENVTEHYAYAPFRFINQHRITIAEDNPGSFIESPPDQDYVESDSNDTSGTLIAMLSHFLRSMTLSTGNKSKSYAMMAGLPWFYQSWSRDIAYSLNSLRLMGNEDEYSGILVALLKHLEKDNASIPNGELKSIDAPLLAIFRLHQAYNRISTKDKIKLRKIAIKLMKRIETENVTTNLLWSKPLETWMDTGDMSFREGACIEMQALLHRTYLFLAQTEQNETQKKKYQKQADELRKTVKVNFIDKTGLIYDCIDSEMKNSEMITPNPFLAYYFSPTLFDKKEWENAFDILLEELENKDIKGMLATLSPNHVKFKPLHTGIDNLSYHRGDSWYFVNCIAGISILDLNKKKYDSKAKEIYERAKRDCLELGALGYPSEISSYQIQESKGCYAQTWSAAMLLELHVKIAFSD